LKYINQQDSSSCSWCIEKEQTPEHFMFKYNRSSRIWKEAYRLIGAARAPRILASKENIFLLRIELTKQKNMLLNGCMYKQSMKSGACI
ncbi:10546_t:CDS:1, partial [Gigaspora margarita]